MSHFQIGGGSHSIWRSRYTVSMQKRTSKRKTKDVNVIASQIVEKATSQQGEPATMSVKNPAAIELGRPGGLKGGKARAEKLTSEQRREIARRAARARWEK